MKTTHRNVTLQHCGRHLIAIAILSLEPCLLLQNRLRVSYVLYNIYEWVPNNLEVNPLCQTAQVTRYLTLDECLFTDR